MKISKKSITIVMFGILLAIASVFSFGVISPKMADAAISDLPEFAPLVAGVFESDHPMSIINAYDYANNTYSYVEGNIDGWQDGTQARRTFVNHNEIANNKSVLTYKPYESGSYVMLHNYLSQQNVQYPTGTYNIDTFYLGIGHEYAVSATNVNQYVTNIDNLQIYISNKYVHDTYKDASSAVYSSTYGVRIRKDNAVTTQTVYTSQGDNVENRYWYQYFDLSTIEVALNDDETIFEDLLDTEGKYTLIFTLSYSTYDPETNQTIAHDPIPCEYSFYLYGDSSYVEYPVFNAKNGDSDVTEYAKADTTGASATEYYNFQSEELPTLFYDASKYNVSYSHAKNLTNEYTTSFTIEDGNGVVRTYKNGVIDHSIYIVLENQKTIRYYKDSALSDLYATLVLNTDSSGNPADHIHTLTLNENVRQTNLQLKAVKDTPISYYNFLQFEELGNYSLTFKYVLGITNDNFLVIPDTAQNLLVNKKVGTTLYTKNLLPTATYNYGILKFEGKLEEITSIEGVDDSADGELMLRIFGVRSYFYKTSHNVSTRHEMIDITNGVAADQTEYVKSAEDSSHVAYTLEPKSGYTYTNVPSTNLQPIYFDYWGTYRYESISGSGVKSPVSKVYKINREDYTRNGDDVTISAGATITSKDFTKDTTLPLANVGVMDGLYIIVTNYTYDSYHNAGLEHTQVFVIEVNNIVPSIIINHGDDMDHMEVLTGVSSYTNRTYINATWADPTYFQGDIYTTINYYPYSTTSVDYGGKEEIATGLNPYQKESAINVRNNLTREGMYEITLHYGLNSALTRTETLFVDRTPVSFNMYEVKEGVEENSYVVPSLVPIGSYTQELDNLTNILNKLFMIGHGEKPSGAEVYITYKAIPFAVNTAYDTETNHKYNYSSYNGVISSSYINTLDAIASSTSNYNYNILDETQNTIQKELVFGAYGSSIYEVTIADQAGNSNVYYFVYDLSTPGIALINEDGDEFITDETHLINAKTTMYFGDYKVVKINDDGTNEIIAALQSIAGGAKWKNTTFITDSSDNEYMLVPLSSNTSTTNDKGNKAYLNKKNGGVDYIITPISADNVQQVVIYKKDNDTHNTQGNYWRTMSTTTASIPFVTGGEGSYNLNVYDTLGNNHTSKVVMNLDKAQLIPWVEMPKYKGGTAQSYAEFSSNPGVFNLDKYYFTYKNGVDVGSGAGTVNVGVEVSYSYFPFSFESYLAKEIDYPEATTQTEEEIKYGKPIPNFPFSRISNKDAIVTGQEEDGKIKTDNINVVAGKTAEGLYIIKRIYTGINESQFDNSGEEDDSYIRYYAMYVDRQGIVQIVSIYNPTSGTTNIDTITSVGDLIYMMLGADLGEGTEDYQTVINSDTLKNLIDNIDPSNNEIPSIITTNKVKVELGSTNDKWATTEKILNPEITDFTYDNIGASEVTQIEGRNTLVSQVTNTKLFGLYIDLCIITNKTKDIADEDYLIRANRLMNGYTWDNIQKILLNEQNTYQFTLYDKSGYDDFNDNHEISMRFTIQYERPQGSFNTVYDNGELVDLSTRATSSDHDTNVVEFASTREKVLEFNFSESTDYQKADIDTSYILVESKEGGLNSSSTWHTIFSIDGEDIYNPRGVNLDNVLRKIEIGTTGKYKYILTLFDEDELDNIADADADASYRVTLRFLGEASYYTTSTGDSFYRNSFAIYVDHKNPEYNLTTLMNTDKAYNGQDLTEYYFAINNGQNPSIFERVDVNDSNEFYLRSLGDTFPTNYYRSVVNDEVSPGPQYPIFSIFDEINYVRYDYTNNNVFDFSNKTGTTNDNAKEAVRSGYYEVIERDEAGNCTVYLIFVSNNDQRMIQFNYARYNQDPPAINMYAGGENSQDGVIQLVSIASIAYANIEDNASLVDQYSIATIKSGSTVLQTLRSNPKDMTINEWFANVVTIVNDIANSRTASYNYSIILTNRFGDDYSIDVLYPGNELMLTIYENNINKTVSATIPAAFNGVNLDEFNVYIWRNGSWDILSESADGIMDRYNTNRTQNVTYIFGQGQYQFVTTDNFGRKRTYNAYVGEEASSVYTFNYGEHTYTDEYGVVYTSSNPVTLDIDENLYKVTVAETSSYEKIYNPSTKRTIYYFGNTIRYHVNICWVTSSDQRGTDYVFEIDSTIPQALFTDINGKELTVDENGLSTFTRNFYITFEQGEYGVTARLILNGITKTIESGHYIDVAGTYTLVLTNGIGSTHRYVFTREDNDFTYYTVKINAHGGYGERTLTRSEYTTANNGRSVHHYYVLNTFFGYVEVIADGNEGYSKSLVDSGTTFELYSIYKVEENIICYVQINYVPASSSNFSALTIQADDEDEHTPATAQEFITVNSLGEKVQKVTIRANAYNQFEGNYISIDYYYNTEYVRTIWTNNDSNIKFEFARAGLHSFVVTDIAGNTQTFGTSTILDIYLLNDIIYRVNDEMPIQNRVYNSTVDLTIISYLKTSLYDTDVTVTALRNGKDYSPSAADRTYRFTESGFYTVTMTTTIRGVQRVTTYSFVITFEDVAHLSFSIPASYGFTLKAVYLNSADITDRFTDPYSLWLSVADTGSGLFTIYMSYFFEESAISYDFNFKIWINEETPTILPVNYTYGTSTSKAVTLQYNSHIIYEQIGNARVVITRNGVTLYNDVITAANADTISNVTIQGTKENAGTYYVQVYDAFDRLVVSYKIIKSVPLNASAKIIIIIGSVLLAAGVVVFIILRRHTRFK